MNELANSELDSVKIYIYLHFFELVRSFCCYIECSSVTFEIWSFDKLPGCIFNYINFQLSFISPFLFFRCLTAVGEGCEDYESVRNIFFPSEIHIYLFLSLWRTADFLFIKL